MNSLPLAAMAADSSVPRSPFREMLHDRMLASVPVSAAGDDSAPQLEFAWTDTELDDSIVTVCDEFPDALMAACSRALEHCRQSTPRGTPASLLTAMRDRLRLDVESGRRVLPAAA
jgi:hypothetical protein